MKKLRGMEVITAADYQKQKEPKASREANKITKYNGNTYHSKKEADRAAQLDLMLRLGYINSFVRQEPLKCEIAGVYITTYICDFVVTHNDGRIEYQDVKGRKSGGPYEMFKIKKRLVRALLGIEIIEI